MHITNFNEIVGKLRIIRVDKENRALKQLCCFIWFRMEFESKRVDIIYYLLLRKQQFAYSRFISN